MLESGSVARERDGIVPTVEERLASLETKVDAIADLPSMVTDLRADMRTAIGELRTEMNHRFDQAGAEMSHRFDQVDRRLDRLERRNEVLDSRMDHHFLWLLGVQVTVLIAIVAALIRVTIDLTNHVA
jgi:tetrahydromethanopterin S-methyltransferase subunit G